MNSPLKHSCGTQAAFLRSSRSKEDRKPWLSFTGICPHPRPFFLAAGSLMNKHRRGRANRMLFPRCPRVKGSESEERLRVSNPAFAPNSRRPAYLMALTAAVSGQPRPRVTWFSQQVGDNGCWGCFFWEYLKWTLSENQIFKSQYHFGRLKMGVCGYWSRCLCFLSFGGRELLSSGCLCLFGGWLQFDVDFSVFFLSLFSYAVESCYLSAWSD